MLAPLLRRDLLHHPILAGLSILRQPQGTNFPVDDDQARELQHLLNLPAPAISPAELYASVRQVAEALPVYAALPVSDPSLVVLPPFMPDRAACAALYAFLMRPLDAIATLVNAGRHLIITGPPGTGKTSLACKPPTRLSG